MSIPVGPRTPHAVRPSSIAGARAEARRVVSLGCCLVVAIAASGCSYMAVGRRPDPIRRDRMAESRLPAREGRAHDSSPLRAPEVPEHPYMAQHGASCMHVDPYTTNAYAWSGPVGRSSQVESLSMGYVGGECPTVNFDRRGRIVTVCVRQRSPSLLLLDPDTLEVLARHSLPVRNTPLFSVRAMTSDTSGGAYFYLDHLDRAVVGTSDGTLDVIAVEEDEDGPRFVRRERHELSRALRREDGSIDKITAVMPDFSGNYWFVGRYGTVGVLHANGRLESIRLRGEEIENSFSMDEQAAYVVSDHALYRLELDAAGKPSVIWRQTYDRGSRRKLGQINQGSGTTPTLLGDDYVVIGDNAEPRMNVVVMRRGREVDQRVVCENPVFTEGASATENTIIGHGRSLVVENNAGYDIFTTMRGGRTSAPGIARVDIRADESGCDVVWESAEISQTTVPKLSTATGLVYLYTKRPDAENGTDAYYFTAVDFETGTTAFRVLAGTGMRFDNHWAAITLGPDGSAYVGVLNGLLRIRDREEAISGDPPLRL